MCNLLSHIHCIVITLNGKHRLFFTRWCGGCVRYCHHNKSSYGVEDFWAIKCGLAPYLQGEVTWEWGGCYSSTCFSHGPSAKILRLSPTASVRWWKGTDYSCSTGQSEEVRKVSPFLMFWSEMRTFRAYCNDNGPMSRKGTLSWHSAYCLWF